jgi:hypothetical protein
MHVKYNLRNPENGDDMFSETLVWTRATRYKVPEEIFNWHHSESNRIQWTSNIILELFTIIIPYVYELSFHIFTVPTYHMLLFQIFWYPWTYNMFIVDSAVQRRNRQMHYNVRVLWSDFNIIILSYSSDTWLSTIKTLKNISFLLGSAILCILLEPTLQRKVSLPSSGWVMFLHTVVQSASYY